MKLYCFQPKNMHFENLTFGEASSPYLWTLKFLYNHNKMKGFSIYLICPHTSPSPRSNFTENFHSRHDANSSLLHNVSHHTGIRTRSHASNHNAPTPPYTSRSPFTAPAYPRGLTLSGSAEGKTHSRVPWEFNK